MRRKGEKRKEEKKWGGGGCGWGGGKREINSQTLILACRTGLNRKDLFFGRCVNDCGWPKVG